VAERHGDLNEMRNLILVLLLFTTYGCSTIEILDGLCYNNKDETFICEEEIPAEPIDTWDLCKPWQHDPETWTNCMMIA